MFDKKRWKKAREKYPKQIENKESLLIIISGSLGAILSTLLSKIDFSKVSLTTIPFVDLIIYTFVLATIVMAFIKLVLWAENLGNIFGEYFLSKNEKKPEK